MSDSFGDGWNSAYWTWTSADGAVVGTGTLSDGSSCAVAICDDSTSGCATLTVTAGNYPSEISWLVEDADGNEVGSGGASTTVAVCSAGPAPHPEYRTLLSSQQPTHDQPNANKPPHLIPTPTLILN